MRSPKISLALVAVMGLGLVSARQPSSAGRPMLSPRPASDSSDVYGRSCFRLNDSEEVLAIGVNDERRSGGVPIVEHDIELSQVARLHAREMARRAQVFPSSAEQLGSRITGWSELAENVGVGRDVDRVLQAFVANATHRANLLDPAFGYAGVGVVRRDDRLWVAMVFTAGADPGSTLGSPCLSLTHPRDLPEDAEGGNRDPAFRRRVSSKDLAFRAANVSGSVNALAGTPHIPVLLADFSDNPAETGLHSPAAFEAMLFQKDYPAGAGSLRDYFLDQSGGLLDVTGEASPWLRMPRPYSDYVGSSYGYQTSGVNDWTLVKDAVAAADPSIDFCNADSNNDGLVDSIFVVHAGAGAEETRAGLWSLRWSLPTAYQTKDVCANGQAAKVKNFTIEPEEYANARYSAPGAPERMVAIGMFVHEFGHELGLPDLYDIDGSSPGGVGPWDPMATGAWGFPGYIPWRPTPLSAWSKVELGWALPTNVEQDSPGLEISSIDRARDGAANGVYHIAKDGAESASEYFLVENREPVGWAADFPAGGLAIWHVHETRRSTDNSDNKLDSDRLLHLVQADGRDDLGSGTGRGDSGDLFPGSSANRLINSLTTPSTDYYSGIDTVIAIERISNPGPTMTADVFITRLRPVTDPSPTPSTSPSVATSPTPQPSPSASPADPPLDAYSPRGLKVVVGRRVRGTVSALATDDGAAVAIQATRSRRAYRARYLTVLRLPADAVSADRLHMEVTVARRMRARIEIQDARTGRWFTLARPRIGPYDPFDVVFGQVNNWVRPDGALKLRFVAQRTTSFVQALDSLTVQPR